MDNKLADGSEFHVGQKVFHVSPTKKTVLTIGKIVESYADSPTWVEIIYPSGKVYHQPTHNLMPVVK